jgi:quercetin dioxygenase-like cupin family protein
MSEMFRKPANPSNSGRPIAPPVAGSVYLDADEAAWQPSGVEGFWIRPLFENPSSGEKTWLMKVDPGAFAPSHAHEELEQVYVLQGSFYDQDRVIGAGDFVCRAPGEPHTSGSNEGAVVLLVYSPAER